MDSVIRRGTTGQEKDKWTGKISDSNHALQFNSPMTLGNLMPLFRAVSHL